MQGLGGAVPVGRDNHHFVEETGVEKRIWASLYFCCIVWEPHPEVFWGHSWWPGIELGLDACRTSAQPDVPSLCLPTPTPWAKVLGDALSSAHGLVLAGSGDLRGC